MQKALTQMNLQLHRVISDITGKTGLKIIRAILAGERNPKTLAALKDGRVRRTTEEIAAALTGDYRVEHLFVLRQELQLYEMYQQQIAQCDEEIEAYLTSLDSHMKYLNACYKCLAWGIRELGIWGVFICIILFCISYQIELEETESATKPLKKKKCCGNEPAFDLKTHLHRICPQVSSYFLLSLD